MAGHPDLHRVLKDLVQLDSEKGNLTFSKKLSGVLLKNLDNVLASRACWVLIKILELEKTKKFVINELKESEVKTALKQNKQNKGLQILHDLLTKTKK